MKEHSDAALNALINASKQATRELSNLKLKSQTSRMKELLIFRRNQLSLIRKRAIELSLTQTDLDDITRYIQDKNN